MPIKFPLKNLPANEELQQRVVEMATNPKYGRQVEITPEGMIKATQKESGVKEVYYPSVTGGKLDRFYFELPGSTIRSATSTSSVSNPKDAIDQQVKFTQRQIQEEYDEKMYQLRQMKLEDEEYYKAAQQIKYDTQIKEFELRQEADRKIMAMNQIDELEKDGTIAPEAATKARFRLAGLPAPTAQENVDLVSTFRQLDDYRNDLERRLKRYYKEDKPTGISKPGLFAKITPLGAYLYTRKVKKAKPKIESALYVEKEEYNPETQTMVTVQVPATPLDKQEYINLTKELIRVKSAQIDLMQQLGQIEATTANQLKVANRLQKAVIGNSATEFYERRGRKDPLGILD